MRASAEAKRDQSTWAAAEQQQSQPTPAPASVRVSPAGRRSRRRAQEEQQLHQSSRRVERPMPPEKAKVDDWVEQQHPRLAYPAAGELARDLEPFRSFGVLQKFENPIKKLYRTSNLAIEVLEDRFRLSSTS